MGGGVAAEGLGFFNYHVAACGVNNASGQERV